MERISKTLSSTGLYVYDIFEMGLLCGLSGVVVGAIAAIVIIFLVDCIAEPLYSLLVFVPPMCIIVAAYGAYYGAIAGFIAGIVGGSLRYPVAFRIGGLIAGISTAILAWEAFSLGVLPVGAIITGLLFGTYLDKQVKLDAPSFYPAKSFKLLSQRTAGVPVLTRMLSFAAIVSLTMLGLAWYWFCLRGG